MTGRLAKEGNKNPVAKKVLKFVANSILIYIFAYRFTLTKDAMTLKKAREVARKYNATIEITYLPDYTLYEAIAPDGFIWNSGDCQIMNIYRDNEVSSSDSYKELIERMQWDIEVDKEFILN